MKWKRPAGILAGVLIILLSGLTGCSRSQEPAQSSQSVHDTGSPLNMQPVQEQAATDPHKTAEAEKYFTQGLQLYEQNQYKAAAETFDKAITADPNNYKVYTAKGIALCFTGDYQSGMVLINKTLELRPNYLPACYDMALAYKLQHDYDQSLFWLEKTIQGDPGNTWSYYGAATIYADRGDAANALLCLRKAIELDKAVKDAARRQSHFDKMRGLPEFQALVK